MVVLTRDLYDVATLNFVVIYDERKVWSLLAFGIKVRQGKIFHGHLTGFDGI